MSALRAMLRAASIGLRVGAGTVAVTRLVKVAATVPPVRPTLTPLSSISVVVPARDEAARIGPLLEAIVGAPCVGEVIVVDDQSSDATADIARRAGARVIEGTPLPDGWAGKAWALQQGIEAARSDWVVTLDADTRPAPMLPGALVARATGDRFDLLTVGGRFDLPTAGSRWLHASMLTTLVYRFGPPGVSVVATRSHDGQRPVHGVRAPLVPRDGGHGTRQRRGRRRHRARSPACHRWMEGRLPRCERTARCPHVRVGRRRLERMGQIACAPWSRSPQPPAVRPRRDRARAGTARSLDCSSAEATLSTWRSQQCASEPSSAPGRPTPATTRPIG